MAYKGNEFRVEAGAACTSLNASTASVSFRFTAHDSKTVSSIRVYLHAEVGISPTYKVGLQADSAGSPSSTWLGGGSGYGTFQMTTTGWTGAITLGATVALTAGTVYHVVVIWHSGSISLTKYIALRKTTPQSLFCPCDSSADSNVDVLYWSLEDVVWYSETGDGVYVLGYNDSTYGGDSYHTTNIEGIFDVNRKREKWVVSGNGTISTIGFVVKKNVSTAPADDLFYDICDSSMTVLRTGTVVAKGTVTTSFAWYDATLSSSLNVSDGVTYYLVLRSASSNSSYYYQVAICLSTTGSPYDVVTYYNTTCYTGSSADGGSNWTDTTYRDITFRATWTAGTPPIYRDFLAPTEFRQDIQVDRNLPTEFRGRFNRDGNIPYEWKIQTWTVSGYVRDENSEGVQGVTITYTGDSNGSTSTDVNGFYSITFIEGSYETITPSYHDWIFSPISQIYYLVANQTNQNYSMTTSTWWDANYQYRKRITFGTDHDIIPAGYTFELPMELGLQRTIATNGFWDEAVGGAAGFAVANQSNNDLWVAYLDNDGSDIWIVKYNRATQSWGTPYFVTLTGSSFDSHLGCSIIADNSGYLHIVYGCHDSQVHYRKSNNTNPASSADWGSEQSPAGGTGATYPRIRVDSQNRIYIFHREYDGTDRGHNGYTRYVSGTGWESFVNLVHIIKDTDMPDPAAYCPGVVIKDNIIYFSFCPLQSYGGANQARGIGFIKGTINADSGVITWTKTDSTSVTVPVGWTPTDTILYPVSQSSAPWYGNNADEVGVNSDGNVYIGYHGWTSNQGEEADEMIVNWTGSAWDITNVSTSVTPNRKAYNGRHINGLIFDANDNLYVFIMVKPPNHEGIAQQCTSTTIRLQSTASSVDDYYNYCYVRIRNATTGAYQERLIKDYNGTTKDCTVDTWDTTPTGTITYVVSKKWFGAEMGELKYNGSTWAFKFLTMNSSMGHGLIASKPSFTNNTYTIVWGRGSDLIYAEIVSQTQKRLDGDDIRVVYSGTEINRVANYFNFIDGKLYFKCQNEIPANKNFSQYSNYWVYYGNSSAFNPKDDPVQVFTKDDGFQLYGADEYIQDKDSWTSPLGFGGEVQNSIEAVTSRMTRGDKCVYMDASCSSKQDLGVTEQQMCEITGYFITDNQPYIELWSGTAAYFRVGRSEFGFWQYYDAGGWHVTSYPCQSSVMHNFRIIVNSSYWTAYGDGNLLIQNDNYAPWTSFRYITLGGISTYERCYWSNIIIKKWLANPPESIVGVEQFGGADVVRYGSLLVENLLRQENYQKNEPFEFNAKKNRDGLFNMDWKGWIARDGNLPIEILIGFLCDWNIPFDWLNQPFKNIPVEWVEHRSRDLHIPIDFKGSIIKDGDMPLNWIISQLTDWNFTVEWLQKPFKDGYLPFDSAGWAVRDGYIPIEEKLDLFKDGSLILEFLQRLNRDGSIPVEWFVTVIKDLLIELEFRGSIYHDCDIPLEWITDHLRDLNISIEWLEHRIKDAQISFDFRGLIAKDGYIPLSWELWYPIIKDLNLPIDFLVGIRKDSLIPLEFRQDIAKDGFIPAEWLGQIHIDKDSLISVEWLSDTIKDSNLPFELKQNLESKGFLPFEFIADLLKSGMVLVEFKQGLNRDGYLPVTWNLFTSIIKDGTLPGEFRLALNKDGLLQFEFKQSILRDALIPIEWRGAILITMDSFLPVEFRSNILGDKYLPLENRLALFRDGLLPFEFLRILQKDGNVPIGWFSSTLKDILLNLEFKQRIYHDGNIPIEFSLWSQVIRDFLVEIEFISRIFRDAEISIEWQGTLLIYFIKLKNFIFRVASIVAGQFKIPTLTSTQITLPDIKDETVKPAQLKNITVKEPEIKEEQFDKSKNSYMSHPSTPASDSDVGIPTRGRVPGGGVDLGTGGKISDEEIYTT